MFRNELAKFNLKLPATSPKNGVARQSKFQDTTSKYENEKNRIISAFDKATIEANKALTDNKQFQTELQDSQKELETFKTKLNSVLTEEYQKLFTLYTLHKTTEQEKEYKRLINRLTTQIGQYQRQLQVNEQNCAAAQLKLTSSKTKFDELSKKAEQNRQEYEAKNKKYQDDLVEHLRAETPVPCPSSPPIPKLIDPTIWETIKDIKRIPSTLAFEALKNQLHKESVQHTAKLLNLYEEKAILLKTQHETIYRAIAEKEAAFLVKVQSQKKLLKTAKETMLASIESDNDAIAKAEKRYAIQINQSTILINEDAKIILDEYKKAEDVFGIPQSSKKNAFVQKQQDAQTELSLHTNFLALNYAKTYEDISFKEATTLQALCDQKVSLEKARAKVLKDIASGETSKIEIAIKDYQAQIIEAQNINSESILAEYKHAEEKFGFRASQRINSFYNAFQKEALHIERFNNEIATYKAVFEKEQKLLKDLQFQKDQLTRAKNAVLQKIDSGNAEQENIHFLTLLIQARNLYNEGDELIAEYRRSESLVGDQSAKISSILNLEKLHREYNQSLTNEIDAAEKIYQSIVELETKTLAKARDTNLEISNAYKALTQSITLYQPKEIIEAYKKYSDLNKAADSRMPLFTDESTQIHQQYQAAVTRFNIVDSKSHESGFKLKLHQFDTDLDRELKAIKQHKPEPKEKEAILASDKAIVAAQLIDLLRSAIEHNIKLWNGKVLCRFWNLSIEIKGEDGKPQYYAVPTGIAQLHKYINTKTEKPLATIEKLTNNKEIVDKRLRGSGITRRKSTADLYDLVSHLNEYLDPTSELSKNDPVATFKQKLTNMGLEIKDIEELKQEVPILPLMK